MGTSVSLPSFIRWCQEIFVRQKVEATKGTMDKRVSDLQHQPESEGYMEERVPDLQHQPESEGYMEERVPDLQHQPESEGYMEERVPDLQHQPESEGYMEERVPDLQYKPDFSTLPYVAWIIIMSHLDVEDRYAASQTCQKLWDIYLDESCLWRSFAFYIGDWEFDMQREMPILPPSESVLFAPSTTEDYISTFFRRQNPNLRLTPAEKFALTENAHRIETVDIVLKKCIDYCTGKDIVLEAITSASKRWKLKRLEIHGPERYSGEEHTNFDHLCSKLPTEIHLFLTKCLKLALTNRLEVLKVHDWRWLDFEVMPAILEILKNAPFTDSMKQLKLSLVRQNRYKFNMLHCSSNLAFTDAVTKFVNLQTLDIPSAFVDDHFLLTLSRTRHTPLKELVIEGGYFHEIKRNSWSKLLASLPALSVHLRLICDFGYHCTNMTAAFPRFVPVTTLHMYNYYDDGVSAGLYDRPLKDHLLHFSEHLKALSYYEQYQDSNCLTRHLDRFLPYIVSRCHKLTRLSFYGHVGALSILHLAKNMPRNWDVFEFFSDRIIFTSLRKRKSKTEEYLNDKLSDLFGRPWRVTKDLKKFESFPMLTRHNRAVGVRMHDSVLNL